MSQNHELTKIKFRIKALSEKTTEAGCSEAEALAALEKVGELLQQYNLTMDEIDIREQKCITVQYDTNSGKHTVASECMVAIAKFTDCRTWWTRRWDENWKKHVVVNFFGAASAPLRVTPRAVKPVVASTYPGPLAAAANLRGT